MAARPFFIHPYAQTRGRNGTPNEEQRRQHALGTTPRSHHSTFEARALQDPAVKGMMADMKLSLAATQLSEQIKESAAFWHSFQSDYWAEVDSIKSYGGETVLQQVWRKKVEYSRMSKGGDKEDDQQFDIQSMKLESCLHQVNEAAQLLVEASTSDYNTWEYDSRQYYLEKVRRTGSSAVTLSKTAKTNEAACSDLLNELAELEKLLDPQGAAKMLYRFNKRQSQNAPKLGEQKNETQSPDKAEDADASRQTESSSNSSPETNEKDDSSWPGNKND